MNDAPLFDPPAPAGPAVNTREQDLLKRIGALLRAVGRPANCTGCGAAIFWVKHLNGRPAPYTAATGSNHFIDCPKAKDFKK